MRILVVDDWTNTQDAFDVFLRLCGCEVDHACDGFSALSKLVMNRPDALVTDHRMPGMSGLELVRRVREMADHKHVPIALISGLPLEDLEVVYKEALALGGHVRCFQKPFDPNDLLAWLRTVVSDGGPQ